MTEQIIKTKKGYSFSRDKVLSIKEVRFKGKLPPKGTTGYVGNCLGELKDNINAGKIAQIDAFDFVADKPFISDGYYCSFFLPQTDVIPPKEKKYRPFNSVSEFLKTLGINKKNRFITFRDKRHPKTIYHVPYGGYFSIDSKFSFFFGTMVLSTLALCVDYEWQNTKGIWLPFGIEIAEESE